MILTINDNVNIHNMISFISIVILAQEKASSRSTCYIQIKYIHTYIHTNTCIYIYTT